MDPLRDVTPLCPCELITAEGARYRCDVPIGVSGNIGNMDYTFMSGNQQRSVPWNSIIAYVNIQDRNQRIDCLPDEKKKAISALETALGSMIGNNPRILTKLSDFATVLDRDAESTARVLEGYSKINPVHRRYIVRREKGETAESPLEYSFSISLNTNY